jgi:uncharacterized protein YbjQ (UPF0145 family)
MIVATAPVIAGHRVVETKGHTFGFVVRSRGFSGNLIAGLRSLAGMLAGLATIVLVPETGGAGLRTGERRYVAEG